MARDPGRRAGSGRFVVFVVRVHQADRSDLPGHRRFPQPSAGETIPGGCRFCGHSWSLVGGIVFIGDAWSGGNFSECLLRSHSEFRWLVARNSRNTPANSSFCLSAFSRRVDLLRDSSTRLFGLHAVISFAVAAGTAGKMGSNFNYFIEPSWAAVFCFALVLSQWRPSPKFGWAMAVTGILLVQSAARMTPHVKKHYQRIAQWPRTMLAVQKYGQRGPLLTMQVGAQVLSGQQPYVADVFILACLNRAGHYDVSPLLDDLRQQRIAAVIARNDIRPDLPGDVIWTEQSVQLVAAYYRPVEQFGDLTVFVPRQLPLDIPVRSSDGENWTGPQRSYHQNGQKASEANMVGGRKHGAERFWDNGGRLWREDPLRARRPAGARDHLARQRPDGKSVQYVNGRRHGLEITWYENGRKWTETPFADGEPHGVSIRWGPDGAEIDETRWERA